jgi:hypothetical protein
MKKVFSVLAVAALILVSFSSCDPQEKSMAEMLTISKGWVLQSATSSPDYVMSTGEEVADLFNGYLYDWEKEYILVFNANGNEVVKPGKTVVPEGEPGFSEETSLGNWAIREGVLEGGTSYDYLDMYIPFVINQQNQVPLCHCQIISFDENMLRLKFRFNDDENPAKGTYEWTLTYVPAK